MNGYTRARIVWLLDLRGPMSADDIADALGHTELDVVYTLLGLLDDGIVERSPFAFYELARTDDAPTDDPHAA